MHDNVVKGVSTGSWISISTRETPKLTTPNPKIFNVIKPTLLKHPFAQPHVGLTWHGNESKGIAGVSRQQWMLTSLILAFIAGTVSLFVINLVGTLNQLPPQVNPPPSQFQLPPPHTTPQSLQGTVHASTPHTSLPPSLLNSKLTIVTDTTCRHTMGNQIVILTNNKRCEDGGEGSVASLCEIGTDYPDCPQRALRIPPPLSLTHIQPDLY